MKKLSVVMVCHQFPPETFGGAERHAWQLARELSRRCEVRVFTASAHHAAISSRPRREVVDGLPVLRIPPSAGAMGPDGAYRDGQVEERFADFLGSRPADVVHFHHLGRLSTGLLDIAREVGAATVLTLHDYWYICPRVNLLLPDGEVCDGPEGGWACGRHLCLATAWPPPPVAGVGLRGRVLRAVARLLPEGISRRLGALLRRASEDPREELGVEEAIARFHHFKELLASADLLISPSRFLLAKYREAGMEWRRAEVVPYGIDLAQFEGFRRARKPGAVRFGFCGSITPHKGVHLVMEAMRELERAGVGGRAELHVWGDGPAEYVDGLRRSAPSNVVFHGRYRRQEIGRAFATFDVLVVPSLWYENAPLVIDEAYATGTPVIASNLGALPEKVEDERSGLLFEAGSAQALAEQMRRLIEDPAMVEHLAQGIPAVATIQESAGRILGLYEEVRGSQGMGTRGLGPSN